MATQTVTTTRPLTVTYYYGGAPDQTYRVPAGTNLDVDLYRGNLYEVTRIAGTYQAADGALVTVLVPAHRLHTASQHAEPITVGCTKCHGGTVPDRRAPWRATTCPTCNGTTITKTYPATT